MPAAIALPDLSPRPFNLTVARLMPLAPDVLYRAWTEGFGWWFAMPESVLIQPQVNTAFFFETYFDGKRHPHYGRFLRLEPNKAIVLTWVTSGTKGAETVVSVELEALESGTKLRLTHAGFPDAESRDGHQKAWPLVLEQLEQKVAEQL